MIRNTSMLRERTFTMLDALEAYQREKEPEPRFKELGMPHGELRHDETKRRMEALPPALRGGAVQRVEDLALTEKCAQCDGLGFKRNEYHNEAYDAVFCVHCIGTGWIVKKAPSVLRRATIIYLVLFGLAAWGLLARWRVL